MPHEGLFWEAYPSIGRKFWKTGQVWGGGGDNAPVQQTGAGLLHGFCERGECESGFGRGAVGFTARDGAHAQDGQHEKCGRDQKDLIVAQCVHKAETLRLAQM